MGDAEGFGFSSWELPVMEQGGLWEEQAGVVWRKTRNSMLTLTCPPSRDLKCVTIVYVCTIVFMFSIISLVAGIL